MKIPRPEYPRPQFVRENWYNLNGEWDFSFDTDCFDQKITVPYAYQSELSGIHTSEIHDTVWYRKAFTLPKSMHGKEIHLHFGAVDYSCTVWVNGKFACEHTGGHSSFSTEITSLLQTGENELTLRVRDVTADLEMPRGKQYWKTASEGIFYTRTTGIWQTVWLEAVCPAHITNVFITPDIDHLSAEFSFTLAGISREKSANLKIRLSRNGKELGTILGEFQTASPVMKLQIPCENQPKESLLWSPENPVLFDAELILSVDGEITDCVQTYFGLRKISIEDGKFCLNGKPYFQKLILDQGYWESSLLTAPDDTDFVRDIAFTKQAGFNGVRKHQKIEDPRYLYHADRLGLLVWGEMPSAQAYSRTYVRRMTDEWIEEITRDYNHPCIAVWTPLNESWGIPTIVTESDTQAHSVAMIYTAKSLDRTRPVIGNDGWAHTNSDLLTIHDYEPNQQVLTERYATIENTLAFCPNDIPLIAQGWHYLGQPVIVSEYGGISYAKSEQQGWGYSVAQTDADFYTRYYQVTAPLLESPVVQGFCYTQLSDVEQEINGILTYQRVPKVDLQIIKAINDGNWKP